MKSEVILATIDDYEVINNLARFYVYEMSRYCGINSKTWSIPNDGLYKIPNLNRFFEEKNRKVFLVKVDGELAGFVFIHEENNIYYISEFFILARFQGRGIGIEVAENILQKFPGKWKISIIPDNESGLLFWRKAVSKITEGEYIEELIDVNYDNYQPKRYFLSFEI
jgi:predicted acetyltransferase